MSLSLIVSPRTSAEGRITVEAGGTSVVISQEVLDKILGGSLSLEDKRRELIDTVTAVEHTHRNRFEKLLEEKMQVDEQNSVLKDMYRDKATSVSMLEARVIVEQAIDNAHEVHKDPVIVALHPKCLIYHNKYHKHQPTPKKALVAHLLEPCPLISVIQTKHGKGSVAWTLPKGNHLAPYVQATSCIFGTLSTGVHLGDGIERMYMSKRFLQNQNSRKAIRDFGTLTTVVIEIVGDAIDDLIKADIAKKKASSCSSISGSSSSSGFSVASSSSGSSSSSAFSLASSISGSSLKRKRQADGSGPTEKKLDEQISLDICYVQFGEPVTYLNVESHKRVDVPPAGSTVYVVDVKAQQGKQVYFWTVGTDDYGITSYEKPKSAPPVDAIFYELSKGLNDPEIFEHKVKYTIYDLPGAAKELFEVARDRENRGPMPPSTMDIEDFNLTQ